MFSKSYRPYRTLTQDVLLYLVAISENTNSDSLRIHRNNTSFTDNGNHDKGGRIQQGPSTKTTKRYVSTSKPRPTSQKG